MVQQVYSNQMYQYFGKSTDTKPTPSFEGVDFTTGKAIATFYEIDTGDLFIYDIEDSEWVKQ